MTLLEAGQVKNDQGLGLMYREVLDRQFVGLELAHGVQCRIRHFYAVDRRLFVVAISKIALCLI